MGPWRGIALSGLGSRAPVGGELHGWNHLFCLRDSEPQRVMVARLPAHGDLSLCCAAVTSREELEQKPVASNNQMLRGATVRFAVSVVGEPAPATIRQSVGSRGEVGG